MAEEKKEVRQVVSGHVKEKTLADKAAGAFLSEDTKTVKNYILWDVLIPGLKNAIADVIIGGIEMALFGNTRGRRSQGRSSGTHVSYSSYYDSDRPVSSRSRMDRRDSSANYDFSDIVLDTRGDAEEVISSMEEIVRKYDCASVADLCSLTGITPRHTDNKWGWTDARDFSYRRAGRGYILDFAKPIYLD